MKDKFDIPDGPELDLIGGVEETIPFRKYKIRKLFEYCMEHKKAIEDLTEEELKQFER